MDEPAETLRTRRRRATPDDGRAEPAGRRHRIEPDAAAGAPAAESEPARTGGGLRVLAALVMLPWLLGYGVIGTWTVARGASAAASGLKSFDAGYTRLVTPAGVILVGALLLAAFAALLAASLLLVLGEPPRRDVGGSRRRGGPARRRVGVGGDSRRPQPSAVGALLLRPGLRRRGRRRHAHRRDPGSAPWHNRATMSTSIFVGHAKPPANTVSGQMYTILSVVCEVDMDTGVIVAAEFTVATELAKEYLNRLLAGRDLSTDEDAIVEELEKCYFSGTQKALIQAFRDMAKRYRAQAS